VEVNGQASNHVSDSKVFSAGWNNLTWREYPNLANFHGMEIWMEMGMPIIKYQKTSI